MHILFITNTIKSMSGASKIIRFVAGEMAKDGHNVAILSIADSEVLNEVAGCKIYTLGCNITQKVIWRIAALAKIRKCVRTQRPDCVCTFVSDACFMARLATLGLKCKIISCDRGDPQSDGLLWSKLSGWAYRNSDACVFQLKEVRDYFGEANLKKSYIIPNPFVPTDTEIVPFENRKKTIVSVGRMTDQKGFDLLISAFKKVQKKHPEYTLILFGDGALKDKLIAQAKEAGLEGSIQFPGFCADIPNNIKDAGIFCLSSRYEGIPNTLLEAMSLGIPVVASDCTPGGARFLTDSGKRGILVPLEDSEALADALCLLIEDETLARNIGEKVLAVRELYSPKEIADQWRKVFGNYEKSNV